MQDVANGNDTPCLVSNENTTTVTLTGCSKDEEIIITYGPYSGLATYKVHSGKSVVVKFVCLEIDQEGVIKQINSSYSAQLTVDEQINVDPLYSLTSLLSSTSTTVGHEIVWTIFFPEHYSLEVTSCTAYPGIDDSSNDSVALISNGGCSSTMDLISNFNSYSNGTATARLLAFKFHNSGSVFLKCSLKVCPPGSPPTACTTTCSKEKRSVQKRASGQPKSIVPATISNVLYVADAHSGGTSGIIEVPTTWIAIFTVMQVLTRNAE
ncbi:uncharacterized protein LOC132740870, partial [Ruditapes philippinarum]|uniref:uncharacterized protein LOC132740870 n=1 Tax=Ruditapes philippinarum TaxID=129788 RepID=UPI00295A63B2